MKKKQSEDSRRVSLDSCPDWAREHKECRPWETKGRSAFGERIAHWIGLYAEESFDRPVPQDESENDELEGRLFACWLSHWKNAGSERSPELVAKAVESGDGYEKGCAFHGNPFFDVVHAVALRKLQKNAEKLFSSRYRNLLVGLAKKIGWVSRESHSADSAPEWWNDFFYFLTVHTGKDRSQPALSSYVGTACLSFWLRAAFSTFLPNWFKRHGKEIELAELDETLYEKAPYGVSEEEFELIRDAMERAVETLNDEERLRLAFHYRDKMKNNDIALVFRENADNATRRRASALKKLLKRFHKIVMENARLRDVYSDRETGAIADAEFVALLADVFDAVPKSPKVPEKPTNPEKPKASKSKKGAKRSVRKTNK